MLTTGAAANPLSPFSLFLLSLSFLALCPAGEREPATMEGSRPLEQLHGSLSTGYDTAYVFRGGRYGDHSPWASIDLTVDYNEQFGVDFGLRYINPTRNVVVNDELDLYGYLRYVIDSPSLGAWEVLLGGELYNYVEDNMDEAEVSLTLTKSVGNWVDLSFEYVYDTTYCANYFGYYATRSIPVVDWLEVELTAGVSHADETYNYKILGGDHVYLQVEATFKLSDELDLSAYMLQNWPYADLAAAGEASDLYGGTKITFSF